MNKHAQNSRIQYHLGTILSVFLPEKANNRESLSKITLLNCHNYVNFCF